MQSVEKNKIILRLKIKKFLSRMTSVDKQHADTIILQKLLQRHEVESAKIVCCYVSFGTEVDTMQLIQQLLKMGKIVLKPEEAVNKLVDLFIVPGLGFDRKLHRLGRGGGFYDRLLANVTVPKIGLAYTCQVIAEVPHSSYDVPITALITEEEL